MHTLNNVEADFIDRLLEAGVRFIVVGGHAVNFYLHGYGALREMKDLDLFYSTEAEDLRNLLSCLNDARITDPELTIETLAQRGVVISKRFIDLKPRIPGVSFEKAWDQREVGWNFQVGGEIPVISLADLLKNKRASGRPQDLDDVALLETRQEGIGSAS